MPYVTVDISDGLGNRFFKVAAALGYAEKYGHVPVFVDSMMDERSHPGPKRICEYFPELQTKNSVLNWITVEESRAGPYTYSELPNVADNVRLRGYFQTMKYFPTAGVPRPAILRGLEARYKNFAFLHVRRGDYLLPICKHHVVDLTNYYRYALSLFADSTTRILVCSDDMEWCRTNLVARYDDLISAERWEFLDKDANDYESLRAMTACGKGGICANSTFSWWAAYWNVGRAQPSGDAFFTMPSVWGSHPLPPITNLLPPWAIALPT